MDRLCPSGSPPSVSLKNTSNVSYPVPSPPIPPEQREPSSSDEGRRETGGRLAASHPPARPRPKPRVRSVPCEDSDAYELVEHRMRGSNPLMLGLRNIAKYGWYWGPVTRVEAEEKLQGDRTTGPSWSVTAQTSAISSASVSALRTRRSTPG